MSAVLGLLAGVDVGTTTVRCALYDDSARLVALASRPTSSAYRFGERLDAERLWGLTLEACTESLARARRERPIAVLGIAVTSIGCVPVWLDAHDRSFCPDMPDEARMAAFRELAGRLSPGEFFAVTGYPLEPSSPACSMAAVPRQQKDAVAAVLSVAEYVAFRLSGRRVREYSSALSMAVWDYRRNGWWTEFLARIGLDPGVLGAPVESAQPIGPLAAGVAETLGLPDSTMVYTGAHDYLAAALAANVGVDREVLNVAGTVEIMASLIGHLDTSLGGGAVRSMRDHHVVPGQYSYMVEAYGADQVEWLRNAVFARPGEDAPDLAPYFAALDELPASSGTARELFIPQLRGRLLPTTDPTLSGAYLGLTSASSGLSILRATIEGLCFQARQMFERQREVLGVRDLRCTSVGGGSRSAAWTRIKADILGVPVFVPRIQEASALGAALLAGTGSGIYRDLAEAGATAAALGEDVFVPSAAMSALYQDIYREAYLPAVEALEAGDVRMRAIVERHATNAGGAMS